MTIEAEGAGQFRMIAVPGISHEQREDRYFSSGHTIADCLREVGWTPDPLHARVTIDGELIPDAQWLTMEPKPNQAVVVRRVYTGGGNTGKQIGQIIGLLAISIAAWYAAPALAGGLAGLASTMGATGATWGGIIGSSGYIWGALTVASSLAMNALVPRSLPRRLPAPLRDLKEAA